MTDGTWNILLIAVAPDHQGQGIGTRMVAQVEQYLAKIGARVLLVETSGLADFEPSFSFHEEGVEAPFARWGTS